MVASKFLNPKNDLCFKRIFGSERNKDIIIHFLNDLLERPSKIEKVTFLKTMQDPEIAALRVSVVDVMCEDQDDNRFVIEMQISKEKGFARRALYYAARAYCSQRKKDHKFKDLKDVYFLAITDFKPFPRKKDWLSRVGLKDLETNEHDIEGIQLLFMQLPLFKKKKQDLQTMTLREKWAYFFKYAEETKEEDLEKIVGKDMIIQRAYEELNRYSWSEKELNAYESIEMKKFADEAVREAAYDDGRKEGKEEGRKEGKEEGRKEGKEEGRKEGKEEGRQKGRREEKREIALAMLENGIPVAQIATITGLPKSDILSLKK